MEFLFFGYRSADFDKNYTKYNGENSRNLVRGGFFLQEDEAQDGTDDY